MSLQVRLKHTLGERLLELPDRPIDAPVVVGRSGSADVQVPTMTVAQRHCVLFVHEGRWAVQDLGGTSGTYVGGKKADGPVFLRIGDVITLGTDASASSIQIEPAAAARGSKGFAIGSSAPLQAPAPSPAPAYVPPAAPGAMEVAPTAVESAAWTQSPAEQPATAASDTVGWVADAGRPYYTRRRRSADYSLPVAIFITVLVVGGVAWYVRRYQAQTAQVVQPAPAPATAPVATHPSTRPEEDTSHLPQSIFDKTDGRRTAKAPRPPTTVATAEPLVSAPGGDAGPEMTVPEGPGQDAIDAPPQAPTAALAQSQADDPAWKQVQTARYSRDEAGAILKFDDYARSNPDRNTADLQAYTDKALDRIWFERIEQLCKQREEWRKKIQEADKDLSEETNDDYKKRVLVPLREQYGKKLQAVEDELTSEMRYSGNAIPNLLDDAELEKLRQQRDAALYNAWKTRVLAHVRRTHGELPWAADKNS